MKIPKTTSTHKVMLALLMTLLGWSWNMVQRIVELETRFEFFYAKPTPEELEARRATAGRK